MNDSIIGIMQKVAQKEAEKIYTNELGIVTALFPHSTESDKNNYQCSVQLKNRKTADGGDFELRKVPVLTGHIGLANIPNIGDLVLVTFVNGNLNAPIITGRLYNEEDVPPISEENTMVLTQTESIKIETNSGTIVEIDKDGNVKITAKGDIIMQEGDKGAARKDDSVEVTIPAGTFITSVSGGGGAPAVGVPNVNPVKVQGKITAASDSVKIG